MDDDFGFNALTDTYEDLVKAGVIDPTKVVRTALQNAASIASLLLTTEALVSEIPEEKKEAAARRRPRRRHGRDGTKAHGRADARLRRFQGLSALRCRSPFLSPSVTIGARGLAMMQKSSASDMLSQTCSSGAASPSCDVHW